MNPNYISFIITHGKLGCTLKKVTEKLIIPSAEFICFSNEEFTLEKIEKDINDHIVSANPDNVVIFVDLVGGSCWLLANRIKRTSEKINVIAGVNVPMLVSYFMNFNRLQWNELMEKVISDGIKGIIQK